MAADAEVGRGHRKVGHGHPPQHFSPTRLNKKGHGIARRGSVCLRWTASHLRDAWGLLGLHDVLLCIKDF